MRIKKWTKDMDLKERQRNFITDLIKKEGLEDFICIILEEKLTSKESIQNFCDELLNHGLMMMMLNDGAEIHKADYDDSYYNTRELSQK